jgi:hypothetical protein
MTVSRIIAPGSKLATARMLNGTTACTSLGRVLGFGGVSAPELYAALDWLKARQAGVEKSLARKHLKGGTRVLYGVSSSYVEGYVEGRCCELARSGYNRGGKKGKMQIVSGLPCAAHGCPAAAGVSGAARPVPRRLPLRPGSSRPASSSSASCSRAIAA